VSIPLLKSPPSTSAPLASSPLPGDSDSGPKVFHNAEAIGDLDDSQPHSSANSNSDDSESDILRPESLYNTWRLARAALAYYRANQIMPLEAREYSTNILFLATLLVVPESHLKLEDINHFPYVHEALQSMTKDLMEYLPDESNKENNDPCSNI